MSETSPEKPWRSLDELAGTPEFRRFVDDEFPGLAAELTAPRSRRSFLKVMGASLGMAGLASCRWPKELILPFADRPEGRIPGVPSRYATAMELGGSAIGLVVTSMDGRPIKVEGNPHHPSSLGAAHAFAQASVLELYDPDRSRRVIRRQAGQEIVATWDDLTAFASEHFGSLRRTGGKGLAVLAEASSSPTIARLRERFREVYPQARWHEVEAVSRDLERVGTAQAFGRPYRPLYRLDRADVIVALDEDFLGMHPESLRHAREFAARRRAEGGSMNRLFVAEATLSLTGAAADHRVALKTERIVRIAQQLLSELRAAGVPGPAPWAVIAGRSAFADGSVEARWARAAARDLAASRGRGLIVAGPRQAPEQHALACALNTALGNAGETVTYVAADDPDRPTHWAAMEELAGSLGRGDVETLLILGGNPAYAAARGARLGLVEGLRGVQTSIHLSLYDDETSSLCTWHVPRAHYLESWGDARAWDGTVSIVQPLIEPLYAGRTAAELLALALGEPSGAHELTRKTFAGLVPADRLEAAWHQALSDGVVAGSAAPTSTPEPRLEATKEAVSQPEGVAGGDEIEVIFFPDAKVYDGRFANNPWLQELPDPLTRLTWDNAALMSPATAARLGVDRGDVVRLAAHDGASGATLEVAVFVLPGQAEDTVALPLGYGRLRGGRVASGSGFDAYAIKVAGDLTRLRVERTGRRYPLATTQDHHAIDAVGLKERNHRVPDIVREGTLAEYLAHPTFAKTPGEERTMLPLWKPIEFTGEYQWGMAIDLSACIGCNACAIACQAENNIPVVGKNRVAQGREMHWIRVDRYFKGRPEAPELVFQPVACQQCENAPCESVCPVAATVHSEEGLNQMVYNRCVGTRYCSNNCPYKVRRFNFFYYWKDLPQTEKMQFNPEVTVRSRGVMEKCTYCIQRIEAVKIAAKNDRRPVRDGEIVPACAQTCPAQAIVFGDLKDEQSRVAGQHREDRAYGVLEELYTRPRTRYLAKLRNPSPAAEET
jgi:MoCo/4Fe-4S cofactor protein with predicted Tat translocation signal